MCAKCIGQALLSTTGVSLTVFLTEERHAGVRALENSPFRPKAKGQKATVHVYNRGCVSHIA